MRQRCNPAATSAPLRRGFLCREQHWLGVASVNWKFLIAATTMLSGCISTITGSTYYDGRFWYSNVKSASDAAGGPRLDLMVIVDSHNGQIVNTVTASGIGTWQAATSGLSAAVVAASGQAAGSALIRPARNTTNVEMNVEGGAAGGGTSSTSATGGAGGTAAGGTSTSATSGTTSSSATGGAGGIGGTGGVGGTGGTGGTGGSSGGNIPPGQLP
jgi:hypothetical protein